MALTEAEKQELQRSIKRADEILENGEPIIGTKLYDEFEHLSALILEYSAKEINEEALENYIQEG